MAGLEQQIRAPNQLTEPANKMETGKTMLKLHDLSKVYRTAEVETVALDSVNVEIESGEFVAIMGPSGCGKSTLLNIIGMLDSPSSGQYLFRGEDISGYSEVRLSDLRKHNIGFIFQSSPVF